MSGDELCDPPNASSHCSIASLALWLPVDLLALGVLWVL